MNSICFLLTTPRVLIKHLVLYLMGSFLVDDMEVGYSLLYYVYVLLTTHDYTNIMIKVHAVGLMYSMMFVTGEM